MRIFNGSVVIPLNEFRTYEELIVAALAARTFDAVTPANNVILKAKAQSIVKAASAAIVFTMPRGNIYTMDNHRKGAVVGGVTDQAAFVAADFTNTPGGGELLQGGKVYPGHIALRFDLGSRLVYAGAETIIDLDVTLG